MDEKILKILNQNFIEIKNFDKISLDLELFFSNSNLDESQIIKLLKIISKLN
jgi:hypothetical protein